MKLTTEEQRRRWREKSKRYYHEHKPQMREKARRYQQEHKDRISDSNRQRYRDNRETILAKRREALQSDPEARQKKRENERRWRKENRETRRAMGKKSYLKNRSGILARRRNRKIASLEAEALRPKPECCEVCGGSNRISFDHCHKRDVFRGWLCHPCNVILGMADDDPNRLRKLIAYLERTKDLIPPQMTLPL